MRITIPSRRRRAVDGIVDAAAGLFARHGFTQTSLQAIADASGYSKPGLLHHVGSKEALYATAVGSCRTAVENIHLDVHGLAPGVERDRRALSALLDFAMAHPGTAALLHSTLGGLVPGAVPAALAVLGRPLLQIFGVDPDDPEPRRLVQVAAALGSLNTLVLMVNHLDPSTSWRDLVLTTCSDCLGHPRPRSSLSLDDQVEA